MTMDSVDVVLSQWSLQRPDIELSAMALVGRLHRSTRLISRRLRDYFKAEGMEEWEFDMLATLRRSGEPYTLSPKDLVATTMVGSSALTHRVDQLLRRGLITREVNPNNRRELLLTLTPEGIDLVDRVLEGHVANEQQQLEGLDADERAQLSMLLRKLLISLGDTP